MLDEKDLQALAAILQGMETRIDQKMGAMETRIDQKLEKQKQDIMSETKGLLARQKQDILDESTRRMKLLLDTEVTTRFNLLAEGQQAIMDAITPKNEIEQIRSEMDVLKLAVRTLSQDLAELKKAQ
ncbi:hypothetical protein [Acidaminococcus intestini]|uniref:hypothetical protein n=1 Tax=Acidaminococcus intestini TaxID=187327 RepID=UPI0027B8B6C2|nr:hypothetical protein [Acidaminococcus intestini]